jgi:hypothetical protein
MEIIKSILQNYGVLSPPKSELFIWNKLFLIWHLSYRFMHNIFLFYTQFFVICIQLFPFYTQLFFHSTSSILYTKFYILRAHCINHWPKFHGRFRFGAIFSVKFHFTLLWWWRKFTLICHSFSQSVSQLVIHRVNFPGGVYNLCSQWFIVLSRYFESFLGNFICLL